MVFRLAAALVPLMIASAASAQWVPGSEITGQQVQVQTNGVTNIITFEPNGVARISSPSGAKVVPATWTAANGELCLTTAGTFDCYAYTAPFQAGQPVDLLSRCAVRSRWLPSAVTLPPGERG
ncbi:hypothetical protein [Sphingomonas sp.]|uniref:hypothetical protein n=1 Tax=Sphingomonas sp. TaxID=28214 RepID=UPI00286DDE3F|nr:hypothetical protein [Sphingomonas sp.]